MDFKAALAGILALFSTAASAQFVVLPPVLGPTPANPGDGVRWTAALPSLQQATNSNLAIEDLVSAYGITFSGARPSTPANYIGFRLIYFGETSSREVSFGATEAAPLTLGGGLYLPVMPTATFGSPATPPLKMWDILSLDRTFSSIDLWASVPGEGGGLYHAFNPGWSAGGPGGFSFSDAFTLPTAGYDLTVNDWVVQNRTTYLLLLEDGLDGLDRSDLILGLQFFVDDAHVDTAAVPEPSTTGVAAALVLVSIALGQVIRRTRL